MHTEIPSLKKHRVQLNAKDNVNEGHVKFSARKSFWFLSMLAVAIVGGSLTISLESILVFIVSTGIVLLLGHSLGSHRKLIHNSYQCPKWLEYVLVYFGVQVGLSGPIGLLQQHELRDFAQRLPTCHPYLRHGSSFWKDAWWQLNCDLHLKHPPRLCIESRIEQDRFYQWLENTWMLQQLPPAIFLYYIGGWPYVIWGVCARITAGVFGHWLIGYFAHNHGAMNYEVKAAAVQGRNIRFTSLLTMGESWHNNHHAFPGSAKLGLYAGELDPGWWVLLGLRKMGLVWDIKLPAHLPAREELIDLRSTMSKKNNSKILQIPIVDESTIGFIEHFRRHLALVPTRENKLLQVSGPAAMLSVSIFQKICGPLIQFRQDSTANRLSLHHKGNLIYGLPVLCFVLCARIRVLRIIGLVLLPLAVGFEHLRLKLEN